MKYTAGTGAAREYYANDVDDDRPVGSVEFIMLSIGLIYILWAVSRCLWDEIKERLK